MRISPIVIIFLCFISSCKDWDYPQSFPIVFTEEIDNISSEGARFIGSVESLGTNQNIISYGFVWSESEIPTLNSTHVTISDNIQKGKFFKTIHNDLVGGNIYYVRAFIKTDNLVIYGNQATFTSQGSLPPAIINFTPNKGFDKTEITIEGQDFSTRAEGNIVKIGALTCEVISATDSLLKIKSPTTNLVGDYKISITVAGKTAISEAEYSILGPRIRSISKLSGRVGDLLTIGGEYFDIGNYMSIYFGAAGQWISNESFPYVLSPNKIECYVPDYSNNVEKLELQSYLNSGQKRYVYPDIFTIINSWEKRSDQTPLGNVQGYKAVSINDLAYIVGGINLYTFNPVTNEWLQKASFPGTPRYHGAAFVINNKLYYGFGENDFDGSRYDDLWVYDPFTNGWEFVMNGPIPARSRLIAFVINNKAYIGFGFSKIQFNSVSYSDFWQFDPVDNSWTEISTPLQNLSGFRASSFSVAGKGYLIGIQNSGVSWDKSADVWEFNAATSTWTRKQDFPDWIQGNPALSLDSSGVVFSGSQYGGSNRVYEYDPMKDRWRKRQTFSGSGRSGESAVLINGRIFYGMGAYTNANSYTPDFWKLIID